MIKKISRREAMKKSGRFIIAATAGSCLSPFLSGCSDQNFSQSAVSDMMRHAKRADIRQIKLTVIYDNMNLNRELSSDWGFSCLIQGTDRTVLFDTGQSADILRSNMAKLKIDPHQIEELVISHDHEDHIGGALALLDDCPGLNVTLVKSFRSGFKRAIEKKGSAVTGISQPAMITKNCISTGEMKNLVKNEHSLIILTDLGSILVVGCSHPGIVDIVERAKRITGQNSLLVMGGFHLFNLFPSKIRKIAMQLKQLGVQFIAPSHCSGAEAYDIFSKIYGSNFIHSGLGRKITAKDLKGGFNGQV